MIQLRPWRAAITLRCAPSHPLSGSTRHASLSAIHRGLRRSENDTSRGKQFSRSWKGDGRDARTSRALDGAATQRQQQKLRKKLAQRAAEEEEEEDPDKKTRRKRFLDPDSSFGKGSLVYQLKYGALRQQAAQLPIKQFVKPRSFRSIQREPGSRTATPESRRDLREDRPAAKTKNAIPKADDDQRSTEIPTRKPKKTLMPMSVKYTTAASQFLYGKSVVKAALEQKRRKLYNLYIYGGDNRKDSRDNEMMEHLAKKQRVPITIVPNENQRLMDKMSMGRPHNGFVLEASPLPQLPIASLGKLEESEARSGFHVQLDHQTKEEADVNGKDTFMRRARSGTSKPFVVLLNEILDPGNLGALLRTASYLGVDAVGITNRNSAALTPVVLKSAAGAVEEVSIFTVDSPATFVKASKDAGWKTYAAVAPPEQKLVRLHGSKFISTDTIEEEKPLAKNPCLLVLGNEGFGLPKPLKMAADFELSIPRFVAKSSVDSLNVSVAAGLLCHAFMKSAQAQSDRPDVAEAEGEASNEVF